MLTQDSSARSTAASRSVSSVAVSHTTRTAVTLIPGDGVGPEIAVAVKRILAAAGAPLDWEECAAGAAVFARGVASGVPVETLDSIRRTGVVLKGPLETPVGHGGKSANVTLRKLFETYANIRPSREISGVATPYSGRGIDFVVVRENVEDLYAGIEHMQSPTVAQCLKLISRKGSEKIIRLAFELALAEGRSSVHCATKANIMKLTEGLFKRVFEEVALDYPQIRAQHIIVDNAAHQMVMRPEQFEVIVTTNLNGDILSDLASGLTGGLGFAPSANLGAQASIFEAVHGSAPDIAGRGLANPSGLLLSAVMMLRHLGHLDTARRVKNALLHVIEAGQVRTADFAQGAAPAGTAAFTEAVIAALDRAPARMAGREYQRLLLPPPGPQADLVPATRADTGADIFIESRLAPVALGTVLEQLCADGAWMLKMISNRGTQVYPGATPYTDCTDVYRCRFVAREGGTAPAPAQAPAIDDAALLALLARIGAQHRWMHVEKLQSFDGAAAYTRAQGED